MKKILFFVILVFICVFAYNFRYSGFWEIRRTLVQSLPNIIDVMIDVKISGYKKINEIDKIYILNLDRDTYRMERMKSVLKELNLGIPYERFSALYGKKAQIINVNNPEEVFQIEDLINNPALKQVSGKFKLQCPNSKLDDLYIEYSSALVKTRFPGEVGCYCSHREIWNDIIANNYKKVLILEDDVAFKDKSKLFLEIGLRNIPEDADLIYLKVSRTKDSIDTSTKSKFYGKIKRDIGSTESYIITQKGAQILLEKTKNYNNPIDIEMSNIIEAGEISAFVIYPMLILSEEFESTIGFK